MPSYAELFRQLAAELDARPGWRLRLWWSDVERFACTRCGLSCTRNWRVEVDRAYSDRMAAPLMQITGQTYEQLFERRPEASERPDERHYAVLAQKPGTSECVFYDARGLCLIHDRLGPEAKPQTCRQYPFNELQVREPLYENPALSLSCTRAASLMREPQNLRYQLLPGSHPFRSLQLVPGRNLSRGTWLVWLGLLLDGLAQGPDFSHWLGRVSAGLNWLLRQPGPELAVPALTALPEAEPLPLSPAESLKLVQSLVAELIVPHSGLREALPWFEAALAEPARLSLSAPEARQLEASLCAYWQRQLLRPLPLLRGELNLLQQTLFIAVQAMLIRLWALYLRAGGPLEDAHLDQAVNWIYALMAQDHAPNASRSWARLRPEICLIQLSALSRWQQPISAAN